MYIKNQTIVLTYRLIYIGLCGYGILRHLSVSDSIRNINMLSYFTIQSNILCFLVMLASAIHTIVCILKDKELKYLRALSFFRGMAFLVITITFFTYSIVLTQTGFTMGNVTTHGLTINDLFVHYMIPIMTWIDFVFFQPKPSFKKLDPIKWLGAPFLYFIFILIRGKYFYTSKTLVGIKRYPYYFLDVGTYGYLYVLRYAFIFLIACIVMGYVIWLLDFSMGLFYTKLTNIRNRLKDKLRIEEK
ncbi:MAG: Pr6Pr family membrane protein [Lachnospiraceae bacterium]|nr:Pr6Pr family membrane protein [Lachnospiraceae bacterium]